MSPICIATCSEFTAKIATSNFSRDKFHTHRKGAAMTPNKMAHPLQVVVCRVCGNESDRHKETQWRAPKADRNSTAQL
jgi:hypothetical protein